MRVPGGLSFSEFKGYEDWSVKAVSRDEPNISAIPGNPTIVQAFKTGIPGNGKLSPDGSKMAKVHWMPTKDLRETGGPLAPGGLRDIEFMLKDSERLSDSHGWGYGNFHYEASSNSWRPGDLKDKPTQANDAKFRAAAMSPCASGIMPSRTMDLVDVLIESIHLASNIGAPGSKRLAGKLSTLRLD